MLDHLRKPLLIAAIVLIVLAFMAELGTTFFVAGTPPKADEVRRVLEREGVPTDAGAGVSVNSKKSPTPGIGISYLAILDALLLYSSLMIGTAVVIPERVQGRIMGVFTLIVSIVVLIIAFFMALAALAALLMMVGLLLAFPFGTAAYMIMFGFFDKGGAATMLSLIMFFKLAFCVFLILAQQQFLRNKGLMLLIVTSLLANVVVSFLHGLVPSVLVSITDALAALIIAILAMIWALILLVRSIPALIRALRVDRALA